MPCAPLYFGLRSTNFSLSRGYLLSFWWGCENNQLIEGKLHLLVEAFLWSQVPGIWDKKWNKSGFLGKWSLPVSILKLVLVLLIRWCRSGAHRKCLFTDQEIADLWVLFHTLTINCSQFYMEWQYFGFLRLHEPFLYGLWIFKSYKLMLSRCWWMF